MPIWGAAHQRIFPPTTHNLCYRYSVSWDLQATTRQQHIHYPLWRSLLWRWHWAEDLTLCHRWLFIFFGNDTIFSEVTRPPIRHIVCISLCFYAVFLRSMYKSFTRVWIIRNIIRVWHTYHLLIQLICSLSREGPRTDKLSNRTSGSRQVNYRSHPSR